MKRLAVMLLVPAMLAACGPMTLAEAERQCFERARLAKHFGPARHRRATF